jgi:hypothetical protein
MKSDGPVVAGWLSLNGVLEVINWFVSNAGPYLGVLLTLCQIAVAVATVFWLFWKIKAAKRKIDTDE